MTADFDSQPLRLDEPTGNKPKGMRGEILLDDRKCHECGYSLRGLPYGGRCPECAAPITKIAPRRAFDVMQAAPNWYLRVLQLAFLMLFIATLWPPVGFILWAARGDPSLALTGFGAAGLWIAGIALLCLPRPAPPEDAKSAGRWLVSRIGALVTQLGWLVAAGIELAAAAPAGGATGSLAGLFLPSGGATGPTPAADEARGAAALIAFLGLPLFGWLAAAFSEWGDDLVRAWRLRSLTLSIVVLVVFFNVLEVLESALGGTPLAIMLKFVKILAQLAIVAVYFYFPWAMFRMSRDAAWSTRHHKGVRKRDRKFVKASLEAREAARREAEERQPFGGPI